MAAMVSGVIARASLPCLLASSLCGCIASPGVVSPTPSTRSAATVAPASSEQMAAIVAASARQGFAGHYFEGGVLYLAFAGSGIERSRDLASRSVRTVRVEHDLQALEAAKQRIVALVNSNPAYGTVGIMADKRRNGVLVDTAILVSGGRGGCPNLLPLPSRDPINGVPIFDERDC